MEVVTIIYQGQSAKAEVLKRNPKNTKVRLIDALGKFPAGRVINAPHTMLADASGSLPVPAAPVPSAPKRAMLDYRSAFFPAFDRHVITAICCLHGDLSPENLHCDGERPAAEARRIGVELRRKLVALEAVLGYSVDESDAFNAVQYWTGKAGGFKAYGG